MAYNYFITYEGVSKISTQDVSENNKDNKGESLLKGTLILTVAGIVVKVGLGWGVLRSILRVLAMWTQVKLLLRIVLIVEIMAL